MQSDAFKRFEAGGASGPNVSSRVSMRMSKFNAAADPRLNRPTPGDGAAPPSRISAAASMFEVGAAAGAAPPPPRARAGGAAVKKSWAEVEKTVEKVVEKGVEKVEEPKKAKKAAKKTKKIMVIYYSMYGHIKTMADQVVAGINATPNCVAELYQCPETLDSATLAKMHAPPKPADVPVLTHDKIATLPDYDAFIFGIPTRFGSVPAQLKAVMDATGGLWFSGALVGKPAATFFSTAGLGGGQETTAWAMMSFFTHHGMPYVPMGYSFAPMASSDEVRGGSPYGAGTLSKSDGSRMPSELELEMAKHQGGQFACFVSKLG